jgi:DNA invertase Pin-like site-specific DNA recombinase
MAHSKVNKVTFASKTKANVPQIQMQQQMQPQMQPQMQQQMQQFNPIMPMQIPMMQMNQQMQQFNPMMQMQMNPYGYMMPMQQMQPMQPMQQMQQMNQQSLIKPSKVKFSKSFNEIIENLDTEETESSDTIESDELIDQIELEKQINKGTGINKSISKEFIPKSDNESNKKRKTMTDEVKVPEENSNSDSDPLPNSTLNSLSNLFDNVLDNSKINKRQKKDVSFLPYKDGRNIVKSVNPINLNDSHFNSDKYPEEKYYIQFLDGHNETISAKDINISALETQKITSEHNKNINKINPDSLLSQANTVIYVRCSKPNDCSIDTQKGACFDYALKHKMKVLPFGYLEDNGIPARNGNNFKSGELSVFMSHIPNDGNIIIYSPDRWSRHTLKGLQELDELVKRNITIHFINNDIKYNKNTSSAHKAIIQSELMTAEKQSNDTSEKIKGTLKRLKTEGHVIGKAPYGYKNIIINGIRKRIIDDKETENIKSIKHKYLDIFNNIGEYAKIDRVYSNKTSIIKFIMRWASRIGMKNRNSAAFSYSQIKTILKAD